MSASLVGSEMCIRDRQLPCTLIASFWLPRSRSAEVAAGLTVSGPSLLTLAAVHNTARYVRRDLCAAGHNGGTRPSGERKVHGSVVSSRASSGRRGHRPGNHTTWKIGFPMSMFRPGPGGARKVDFPRSTCRAR
eukprot:12246320-Alexandrium_andersonii.AAC.1